MMGLMADRLAVNMEVRAHPHDFSAWMQVEQRRVFLLCHRLLRDRDEADTATQEVFLKAYRALSRPDAENLEDPAKWLTRVAVNTCLDRLRSRRWQFWRRRPEPDDEKTILELTASRGPSAEDKMFAKQIAERLSEALEKLSLRQRAVFTLRHYEDRSLEEIAGVLQLDVGTVKAHMARALVKLRAELRDLYGGLGRTKRRADGSAGN
jgi:RNA polymerase sigma-70 factor (ECF subfamily)